MSLPIFDIIQLSGGGVATGVYSVVLFLAFISTGTSCVFAFIARFENVMKVPENKEARRVILGILLIAISCAVSMLGLMTIVSVGYSYLGAIAVF